MKVVKEAGLSEGTQDTNAKMFRALLLSEMGVPRKRSSLGKVQMNILLERMLRNNQRRHKDSYITGLTKHREKDVSKGFLN